MNKLETTKKCCKIVGIIDYTNQRQSLLSEIRLDGNKIIKSGNREISTLLSHDIHNTKKLVS